MKRMVKEVNIKANDPLLLMPYNKYYLLDKVESKKYYTDIEACKLHQNNYKKGTFFKRHQIKAFQQQFTKDKRKD